MQRPAIFHLLASLALSALLSSAAHAGETQPAPVKALPAVLIIGDSISGGYTKKVIQLLEGKAEVLRIPGNGEHTGTGLKKIDEWLSAKPHWDVIHFNWGLWDMYGWQYDSEDRSPEMYEQRLEKLVAKLQETGATLIWATTTPACPDAEKTMRERFKKTVQITPDIQQKYHDAALRVMKKNNVAVNDLHAAILPELKKYQQSPDNVHFNGAGYNFLAAQVAKTIAEKLKTAAPDAPPTR